MGWGLRSVGLACAVGLALSWGSSSTLAQAPRGKTRGLGHEKRVALVVGNSRYRFIPALNNPRNDAKLVAETLRSLGFTLVGGGPQLDLDKADFDRAVIDFGQILSQGADVALFYYAGHGLQVRGNNYLVPISANPQREADVDFQMLDANLVLRQMEGTGTRLRVMILDACRNNPFGGRGLRSAAGGLAQMQAPEGTIISYATQPGNVALDGIGDSPFTKALAQTLRKPGLDVFRTFNEVAVEVKDVTGGQQQPWFASSPIDGDFYFAGASQGGTVATTPAPASVDPMAMELAFWESIKSSTDAADFRAYLDQYKTGRFAALARNRIAALSKAQPPTTQQAAVIPSPGMVNRPPSGQPITLKIGVMSAFSGPSAGAVFAKGSVAAAQMAVEDYGAAARGLHIEIVEADHQGRPDLAASLARQMIDNGVTAIVDVPLSATALSVNQVVRERNSVVLVSGALTPELTGAMCTANTIHWTYDSWALANAIGTGLVRNGRDSWFFLTQDFGFGHSLEEDTAASIARSGGRVLGQALHPLANRDFTAAFVSARNSQAKVIGLASVGPDMINAVRQAADLRGPGQQLAVPFATILDIHGLGLSSAHGLMVADAWYWDLNDGSRAFAARFAQRMGGQYPMTEQTGVYASVIHYLKAVDALRDSSDGRAVVAKMKSMATDDPLFGRGSIRRDGRAIHPMYVFEVKHPSESSSAWDLYKLQTTIPADQAFRPLSEGRCPL